MDSKMPVTIYHNPKCSKSRQTLELIREKGIEPTVIEYLKSPPTQKELKDILKLLGMEAKELLRKKESVYKELKLDQSSLSKNDLISVMIENPILIERPIVLADGKAVLGRPPENVISLL